MFFSERKNYVKYVSEELDTEYFDGLRLNMDSLAAGTFYLLDGNGAIITAGDTKQTKSLSRFVTSNSERNGFQKAWDEVDHESNPSGKIYYMYQGDDYVTYYSDVDYTDWGIRVTENLSEQRETGRAYSFMLGLVLLFLVLCLFVAQILVTKNIMTPIENIMSVFDTIKKTQDYSIRILESNSTEMNRLADEINELLLPTIPIERVEYRENIKNKNELIHDLKEKAVKLYEDKEALFPEAEQIREIERVILLKVIDRKWMDHIDDMDQLKQGIGLQALGQRDPVVQYKMMGYDMFDEMTAGITEDTVRLLMHIQVEQKVEREQVAKVTGTNKDEGPSVKGPARRTEKKIYPNDPCPCGSGKKYKNCCGRKA